MLGHFHKASGVISTFTAKTCCAWLAASPQPFVIDEVAQDLTADLD